MPGGSTTARRLGIALAAAATATAAVVAGTVAVRSLKARRSTPRRGPLHLPTARVDRTAAVAGIGARAGTGYVAMRARSALASDRRREELRARFELRTAEQVAEMLGGMKGALMKLGQMASYLDQGLPEPVRAALGELQADAPPMSAELAAETVRAELGADPHEVFAEWEDEPMAAASIGQVHRAVTHDGRAVAVKVQYPGVDEAVTADLENTDLLFGVMSMLFPGMDPGPIVDELRVRLVEELDYRTEAAHQRLFADHFRGHPFIHVPDVVGELSTSRVLVTELAEGARFAEVVDWPDEERQLAAECLYRFAFGSIYGLHAFNGDPHPGNYLFRPGGQVTFLDFGLCKRFTPEDVSVFERMIRAMVIDRDLEEFQRVVEEVGILPPGLEVPAEDLLGYFGHFYEFVMDDEVSTITPEWSAKSVRQFFDLSGPYAHLMKAANLPGSMVIVQRINLGLFALFGELGATANWRRIAEELWPFADGPPSTPMGEAIAEWEATRAATA